jgi:hypothetical protein
MSEVDTIKSIKHNLRTIKQQSVVNDKDNYLIVDNKVIKYKTKNKQVTQISKRLLNDMKNIEQEHRELLRENSNQSLNKSRHNSYCEGVLTFSDSIKNKDIDKVVELGIKTINDIVKELDTKLHYITLHLDEKGLPHFHYYMNGFNSLGKSISIKQKKNRGKSLQDIGSSYFQSMGFERGISKEQTNRKYLTTKEYKEYKDNKKEIEQLKKDNQMLILDNQQLEEQYKQVLNLLSETHNEISNDINQIVNDLYTLKETSNISTFLKKVKRYCNNPSKLEKLVDKYQKSLDKQLEKKNINNNNKR